MKNDRVLILDETFLCCGTKVNVYMHSKVRGREMIAYGTSQSP